MMYFIPSLNHLSSYPHYDKDCNFNMILTFMNENVYLQGNFSSKITRYLNYYRAGDVHISTTILGSYWVVTISSKIYNIKITTISQFYPK